jgi:CheY-like chemotaxis protein
LRRAWQDSAEQAGLEYQATLDADIPEVLIGDGKRLKQVLGNLLSNAIKFTERGGVNLSIKLAEKSGDAATVVFAVTDTGVGIGADQREQLFEAFSQADGTMTRQYGGTGMGLSIAQKLVGLMGGQIEVESAPGEGSTFRFPLDLRVGEASLEGAEMSGELDLSAIRGASILLVDDSDLNLQVAGELLRQAELYVDVAHDGSEAVDKVKAGQYDCVLMDVQMPVMDGYTATESIRASAEYRDLPIIAMTANALPQDRARGAEAGMNDYVPKPIEPGVLHRALLKWIPAGERSYEAQEVPEEQVALEELPEELPGLQISSGLARLGGNAGLYLELLDSLCADYSDTTSRLQAMLDADDREGARQLAHKLRGIANNLGAVDLGVCAENIELTLKSEQALADDSLANLDVAMALTMDAQAALAPLAASGPDDSPMDSAQRMQLLEQLRQAIADNNPEALDIAGELLSGLSEGDNEFGVLTAIRDALDIYDFAGAADQLGDLPS